MGADVFAKDKGNVEVAIADLTAALTKHASVAAAVGDKVASETGWSYVGLDPTPAPLGEVSIGAAIETFTGAKFGSSGTLAAARVITTAVKAVPVKQVGYSGLMVPVMEDKLLAERWAENRLTISTRCSPPQQFAALGSTRSLFQETSALSKSNASSATWPPLALKWNKPLSARLQPVQGKKAGDRTDFQDPYLFNTTIHPVP